MSKLLVDEISDADNTGPVTVTDGLIGDVTGTLTGNVTGNLTGNVTGNINGLTPQASNMQPYNAVINGAMTVWQRGESFTSTTGFYADRWSKATNTNDTNVVTKYDIPSAGETGLPIGFTNAIKFAWTAGSTGTLNDFRTKIEDPKRFMGQTVTLSYYIRASVACTINSRRLVFTNVTNPPSNPSLPSLSVTTTWQRVVHTLTLGSSATAVFSATSFLDVVLSNPKNTTTDVYITGVQLEVGSTASPFAHENYADTLQKCQRYYYKIGGETNRTGFATTAAHTTSDGFGIMHYPVTMRSAPSVSLSGTPSSDYYLTGQNGNRFLTSFGTEGPNKYSCTLAPISAGNLVIGSAYWFNAATAIASIRFDAEL